MQPRHYSPLSHGGHIVPGDQKKLCFTTLSLAPTVLTARLCVVKQSFFGLPGQYGRRVTKANNGYGYLWQTGVVRLFSNCLQMTSKCGTNRKSETWGYSRLCHFFSLTTFWRPLSKKEKMELHSFHIIKKQKMLLTSSVRLSSFRS